MAANMTDDLLNDDMDFMLSQVAENEHFIFFLLKLKILEAKVKFWSGTHMTTFSEKILDFFKILEESEQFFLLFLKKMENLRRFLSIFEVRGSNFFLNVVWLKYDHFFIAKLIIWLVWIKQIA